MNRIKLLSTYFPYGLKGEVVTIPEEVTQLLAWHYDIFGELEWWGIARENPNS